MARGKGKKKVQSRKIKVAQPANDVFVGEFAPTLARQGHNQFRKLGASVKGTHGAAVRVIPPIETLYNAGKLTAAEFLALDYYREQANRAEDDVAQEGTLSASRIMGGCNSSVGGQIPVSLLCTPAILETARLERDLGSLLEIAQAIARDDKTISAWCIEQHGGRERYDGDGKFVAMVPQAEKRVTAMALLELKFAARRIAR